MSYKINMMKQIKVFATVLIVIWFIGACQSPNQAPEESMQESTSYAPGIGDLMGKLQWHHNKLWFAGVNENWELAEFALHELEETLEDLEDFHGDRSELQTLSMIFPPLELVHEQVEEQNLEEFKKGYLILTNTCNSCHDASGFGFIEMAIPTTPAFSNQVY